MAKTKQGISTVKGFQKKVPNAEKVNDLEITKDENGVLKIGGIIIPQKKLLWEGERSYDARPNYADDGLSAPTLTYNNTTLYFDFPFAFSDDMAGYEVIISGVKCRGYFTDRSKNALASTYDSKEFELDYDGTEHNGKYVMEYKTAEIWRRNGYIYVRIKYHAKYNDGTQLENWYTTNTWKEFGTIQKVYGFIE